jgi:hypothetical protein
MKLHFFWLVGDKGYAAEALNHRGDFTEQFAYQRLEHVFGRDHVFANVTIPKSKGKTVSEIDVLVVFGDQAIIVQTKSKKLTIEARKGNDLQIKDDFKKAVQDAYDQALECAKAILDPSTVLLDASGNRVGPFPELSMVYPVCIVADHYPALAFQARGFLQYETSEKIAAPVVTDVFALDVIAEMLETPLRFLSYLRLRAQFGERLFSSHELTLLSYHLKRNLWIDDEFDMMMLDDSIAADLDVAMAVRRDGVAGQRTPEGILTRFKGTHIDRLISEIEKRPDPATLALGFLIMELNEDTIDILNQAIAKIIAQAREDFGEHDITLGFKKPSTGLSIHCNQFSEAKAKARLFAHCQARKYAERAETWFGLSLSADDGSIRFGLVLEGAWEQNDLLDKSAANLSAGMKPNELKAHLAKGPKAQKKKKIGRNDPCPCGSGKKYKKCCLQ